MKRTWLRSSQRVCKHWNDCHRINNSTLFQLRISRRTNDWYDTISHANFHWSIYKQFVDVHLNRRGLDFTIFFIMLLGSNREISLQRNRSISALSMDLSYPQHGTTNGHSSNCTETLYEACDPLNIEWSICLSDILMTMTSWDADEYMWIDVSPLTGFLSMVCHEKEYSLHTGFRAYL